MNAFFNETLGFLGLFFGFLAFFFAIWAFWQTRKLNAFRKIFFAGKTDGNLEEVLMTLNQKIKNLEEESLVNSGGIKKLEHTLGFAVQKVGVVRYSPFADGGGNYSFSLALLNAQDSGIIITNMYGRQQSRVYTKKITNGKSEIPLTEEETEAISIANNNQNQTLNN